MPIQIGEKYQNCSRCGEYVTVSGLMKSNKENEGLICQVCSDLDLLEQVQTELSAIKSSCKWAYDQFFDTWETECGNRFVLYRDAPENSQMKFCLYCGHKIKGKSALDTRWLVESDDID